MSELYNVVLIPACVTVVMLILVGYRVLQVGNQIKEEDKNQNKKLLFTTGLLFVALIISEILYSFTIYQNLIQTGITQFPRNELQMSVLLFCLAIVLKGLVGYVFVPKSLHNDDYFKKQTNWERYLVFSEEQEKINNSRNNGRGPKLLVFMVFLMSIVAFPGVLGLIFALQSVQG